MDEGKVIEEIEAVKFRKSAEEIERFEKIIETLHPPISRKMISALLDTFVLDDDNGTQESVVSKLTMCDPADYCEVLSTRISSMILRSEEWAEDVLFRAISDYPIQLHSALIKLSHDDLSNILRFVYNKNSNLYSGVDKFIKLF